MGQDGTAKTYLDVEDLDVYRKLCQLHLEVCGLSQGWPVHELYELGSQVRRSSNSAPAQLAEKNDDRHVKNKVEGGNRSRGEAAETVHHLFIAKLKGYIAEESYRAYQSRYRQCVRMLNGLEKALECHLPPSDRRWHVEEAGDAYAGPATPRTQGWPCLPESPTETADQL